MRKEKKKKKKKKKLWIHEEQVVNNEVNSGDYMNLVDNFVQVIVERAKREYLGCCANGGVETPVREKSEDDRLHAGWFRYPFQKPRQLLSK